MKLNARQEKMQRKRMNALSPLGIEFSVFIRDGRMYYYDGVELMEDQARILLRTTKRLMREARLPPWARRPVATGSIGGFAFEIDGDRMIDAAGREVGRHPALAEYAVRIGSKTTRRHGSYH